MLHRATLISNTFLERERLRREHIFLKFHARTLTSILSQRERRQTNAYLSLRNSFGTTSSYLPFV